MTVSSFTSVSLTPPQVLISLAQNARTHSLVSRSRSFGVSILSANQQDIADRFAGRIAEELDRLTGLETFTLVTGTPLIVGALAHLDCRVLTTLGAGANTIFIGEVVAAQSIEDGNRFRKFIRSGCHERTSDRR